VLRLYGEQSYLVPPLPVPDMRALPELGELGGVDSVRLFVERARATGSGFALTPNNAPAVAAICARVDGLPLAIELAAARSRLLSASALLDRLDQRLRVLAGGLRDVPARQQTMRATIAWSYDLLSAGERRLFRQLAVFSGGWTLEAAAAVYSPEGDSPLDVEQAVLDGLAALVDHNLIRRNEHPDGSVRCDMLETIREYGLEQLHAAEEMGRTCERHFQYFLSLAEQAEPELRAASQSLWLNRLDLELDNLRAALEWCLTGEDGARDVVAGMRLAGALGWFWWMRGHVTEGRGWLSRLLAQSPQRSPARVKALQAAGYLAERQGDATGAIALLDEALTVSRALDDSAGSAFALHTMGRLLADQGQHRRATELLEQSLALCREIGDDWGATRAIHFLADVAYANGEHDRAAALLDEGLVLCRKHGDQHGVAYSLRGLGDIMRERGAYEEASRLIRESLTLVHQLEDLPCISRCLDRLAWVAGLEGQHQRAARLLGATEAVRDTIAAPLPPRDRAEHEHTTEAARAQLGDERFHENLAAGKETPLRDAIAYALAPETAAQQQPMAPSGMGLSRRETEVLRLLADGLTNQEIAAALFISPHTAANHVAHIMNKLGLDSRAAAAAWAVRHGIG
jgi:non-specific serine/threonine protein kinase